jgi:hypothetical protein
VAERSDASPPWAIARVRTSSARRTRPTLAVATAIAAASLGVSACGGGGGADASQLSNRPAPPASDFPAAKGKNLSQILRTSQAQRSNLVVSPTEAVYTKGRNRFGFGVFTVSQAQVTDAQVAIYAAPSGGGEAVGPYPARVESLAVKPQFESQTTATDPDAAKAVYVTNVDLDRNGSWDVVAMLRDGSAYSATLIPSIKVGGSTDIPSVGQRPPRIHTPTVADVGGDVGQIDTRSPHDDMHKVDFADVLGKKPIVLLFATPALCQSRVCGPVVDVAEQVEHEAGDGVDFIHMEVYNNNNAGDGLRPQMREFGLHTEPWAFVIDRNGRVSTRLQGAFDASELESAVKKVSG